MTDPRAALDAIGQLADVEIDIAGAALQLARIDAPEEDWQAAQAHLSEIARDAAALAAELGSQDVASRAGALAGLIGGRHRYSGDTDSYDDVQNANLLHVIRRRRGLPVALGIIWLHCSRTLGWTAHGLDFPGHFLIALEGRPIRGRVQPAPQQAVLDVFAGGVPLDAAALEGLLRRVQGPSAELKPGVLAPMSARRVLLRLQENIRTRRLMAEDFEGGLACTLDMLRLAPDTAPLWRDAAVLHERAGQVAAAIRSWTRLLELNPEGETARRAKAAVNELRARLN